MKNHEGSKTILGMDVELAVLSRELFLLQTRYALKIVERLGMQQA